MNKILVTAFDPFGGAKVNPSQMALGQLPDEIAGTIVAKQVIPTVFDKSIETLYEAIDREQPDAVICVGQAGGRPNITVERVAINCDDARIPDNEGKQPIDRTIVAEGAPAYFATLPIKAMVENCKNDGVDAAVSNTAGTFVCNHLMYAACHYAATKKPVMKAGFIHIPYVPEQTVDLTDTPAMELEQIVKGLTSMIATVAKVDEDIVVTGGAEH